MNSPTRRFMLLAPLALSVLCGLMVWSLQLGSVVLSWRQTMAAWGFHRRPSPACWTLLSCNCGCPEPCWRP